MIVDDSLAICSVEQEIQSMTVGAVINKQKLARLANCDGSYFNLVSRYG